MLKCLGGLRTEYSLSLMSSFTIYIERVDSNPIEFEVADIELERCIKQSSNNYRIVCDSVGIVGSDSDHSNISYTEAVGPFGRYEWSFSTY